MTTSNASWEPEEVLNAVSTQNKSSMADDVTFGLFVSIHTDGGAFRFVFNVCGLLMRGTLPAASLEWWAVNPGSRK